jgi:hypothetical protein
LPGTAGVIGVAHTVQASVTAATSVTLENVNHVQVGMLVTGDQILGSVTVSAINSANNTVQLSSAQTVTAQSVLQFGDIDTVLSQPFTRTHTNSVDAYRNTWYTLGANTAADGKGLQTSSSTVAQFLTANVPLIP